MSEKNEQDKSFADTVLLVKPSSTKDTSKMANAPQSLFAKYSHITGVVALYWSVSISMVFLNKYLLKVRSRLLILHNVWHHIKQIIRTSKLPKVQRFFSIKSWFAVNANEVNTHTLSSPCLH